MSQNDHNDLPEVNEGEAEVLDGGDTLEETETSDADNPFRSITEEEREEGRIFGKSVLDFDDGDPVESEMISSSILDELAEASRRHRVTITLTFYPFEGEVEELEDNGEG
jgi:hypothetical protein